MKTAKIYNQSVSANSTIDGSSFFPSAKFDEDGVVQISATNNPTIKIQGRASTEAPWVDIVLNAAGATSTTVNSGYFTIPLFPEMRATVTGPAAATAVVSIWLAD